VTRHKNPVAIAPGSDITLDNSAAGMVGIAVIITDFDVTIYNIVTILEITVVTFPDIAAKMNIFVAAFTNSAVI
jgi:hypothetical protein